MPIYSLTPTPAGAPIKSKDKDAEKIKPKTISRSKTL